MATKIEEEDNVVYTTPKQNPSETQGGDGGGVVNPDGQGAGAAGGSAGGGEIPVPKRQNRNRKELGEYHAPYDQNDLNKAKKQGRRESRMATAGHIMDTMARLFNYGATVNGAPSAHWANRNREFDRNTYYDKLKGANDKARQDYLNMVFGANKADDAEYQADINLYDKQKKWKDKEDERNQKQPLIDADVENKKADTEKKRIEAEWLPKTKQAEIDTETSKQTENYSSAAKNNRENENYYIYTGGDKYKQYGKADKEQWAQDVIAIANKMQIPLVDEYEKIVEEERRNGKTTITTENKDRTLDRIAAEIQTKIRARETPIE